MSDKIWVIDNVGYRKERKVFHTKSGMERFTSGGGKYEVVEYTLSNKFTASDYVANKKAEMEANIRDKTIDSILGNGDGELEKLNNILSLSDDLLEYIKTNKVDDRFHIRDMVSNKYDIDKFKRGLTRVKRFLLNEFCKTEEDYRRILTIHNFRNLPTDWIRSEKRTMTTKESELKYPERHKMFDDAKKSLK